MAKYRIIFQFNKYVPQIKRFWGWNYWDCNDYSEFLSVIWEGRVLGYETIKEAEAYINKCKTCIEL